MISNLDNNRKKLNYFLLTISKQIQRPILGNQSLFNIMTVKISNFFQNRKTQHPTLIMLAGPAYISGIQSSGSDLSCVFVAKKFSLGSFVICTVVERTSLCSKIVRKVKLLCMDLQLFWLKEVPLLAILTRNISSNFFP